MSIPLIICFGDSLTVGYQSPTPDDPEYRETPYGGFLQEQLGGRASVAVSGVSGEVTGEMVLRFRSDVLAHKPAYVVILGGTNDLGWNADPPAIMRNLLKMYEQALAAGVRLVAVTVPSLRAGGDIGGGEAATWLAALIKNRGLLNQLIVDYCLGKGVTCVDFFTATQDPATGELAVEYSNDGLHLNTNGYRTLAMLLHNQVFGPAFGLSSQDGPSGS